MTNDSNDADNLSPRRQHLKRLDSLKRERQRILSLSGREALNAILDHPQPRALVHSFAEEDLFFLIHLIGPEDALDLIALASNRQWEYLLDVETWEKDRVDFSALTRWLNLLLTADPKRLTDWMSEERPDLLEYYLFRTIDVAVREHDQDPSDFGDGFLTCDDVYYVRLPDEEDGHPAEPEEKLLQKEFLSRLLDYLAARDHVFYQQTLLMSRQVIPAESEEEAFRLKTVRLSEKGMPSFEEAVGVYQPIRPDQVKQRKKRLPHRRRIDEMVPAPIQPVSLMEGASPFSRALSRITAADLLEPLQVEFAGLCNRLIAADGRPVRSREDLATIVRKACGYISMGLERLIGDGAGDGPAEKDKLSRYAAYIRAYPLVDLFRAGYGLAAELQTQARSWRKTAWFINSRLPLTFWGERLTGVIGGLLLKRPRFYDPGLSSGHYREFAALSDIVQTREALLEAMGFDSLLGRMPAAARDISKTRPVTFQNLLLTLWARCRLGMNDWAIPIPAKQFQPFFDGMWDVAEAPSPQTPNIRESIKTDFLNWLSEVSGSPAPDISQRLGRALEAMFHEIEEQMALVLGQPLNPRYVGMFLLE